MKNTTEVPNELLIEAHKEACDKWKKKIEELNPSLFKPKFKVNAWYKLNDGDVKIFRVSELKNSRVFTDVEGDDFHINSWNAERCTELSPSEIESHLIKEAEKRGFINDAKFKCLFIGTGIINGKIKYNPDETDIDELWNGSSCLYKDGKWATIIPQEEVLTLEERVKRLEEKLSK